MGLIIFSRNNKKISKIYKRETYFLLLWRLLVQDQGTSWSESRESFLPGCRLPTFHCILTWQRMERVSKLSSDSHKGTNLIREGSTFITSCNPSYLLKALPLNTIIPAGMGRQVLTWIWENSKHSVHNTLPLAPHNSWPSYMQNSLIIFLKPQKS